jgi:hypothetical protein
MEFDDDGDGLDHWRLNDELSICYAALLHVGVDPSGKDAESINWKSHEKPVGYEATALAFTAALRKDSITGRKVFDPDSGYNGEICGELNIYASSVDVDSLKRWLTARGIRTGFFFPAALDVPDYLNPSHRRYSDKLAATVHAWLSAEIRPGKKPKQELEIWLRQHAAEFNLTNEAGNPVTKAMEECSIVANWDIVGGAGKTPGG